MKIWAPWFYRVFSPYRGHISKYELLGVQLVNRKWYGKIFAPLCNFLSYFWWWILFYIFYRKLMKLIYNVLFVFFFLFDPNANEFLSLRDGKQRTGDISKRWKLWLYPYPATRRKIRGMKNKDGKCSKEWNCAYIPVRWTNTRKYMYFRVHRVNLR